MALQKRGSQARQRRRSDKTLMRDVAADGAITDRVALRAYERFLSRGGLHGRDLEDWLEAEREVWNGDGAMSPGADAARGAGQPPPSALRNAPRERSSQISEID